MKKLLFISILLLVISCVPTKTIIKEDSTIQAKFTEVNNQLGVYNAKLDEVSKSIKSTQDRVTELLNENISYEEQKFDSLGRLISVIKQNTNRTNNKEVDTQINETSETVLTLNQVDSIIQSQISKLEYERVVVQEKIVTIGLNFLQKLFIILGIIFIVLLALFVIYKIFKPKIPFINKFL